MLIIFLEHLVFLKAVIFKRIFRFHLDVGYLSHLSTEKIQSFVSFYIIETLFDVKKAFYFLLHSLTSNVKLLM